MILPLAEILDEVAANVIAASGELTELDSNIGDADHGLNMKRGFEAVIADRDKILSAGLQEGLKQIGMTLVMKVGGASGPLYGTLFMTLAKVLPEHPEPTDAAHSLRVAIEAVKARGKADIGAKTMLDVLVPVADEIEKSDASFASVRAAATAAAKSTIPIKATRGRASFLGDRSIGHMDPGARSSEIMITSICNVLERQK